MKHFEMLYIFMIIQGLHVVFFYVCLLIKHMSAQEKLCILAIFIMYLNVHVASSSSENCVKVKIEIFFSLRSISINMVNRKTKDNWE